MFRVNNKNNILYLTIKPFDDSGIVRHAFSTRIGGVSTGEAASMNFGFNRKDTVENIKTNFELLCDIAGIDDKNLVMAKQVHKDTIYCATKKDIGKRIEAVDALVTNIPGVALCTFHADCVPLYFLDPKKKVIALAHSGWRSTKLNIAAKTIQKMKYEYGCNSNDILVAIAPSIGPCHFEVGTDVADQFDEKYITYKEKPHLNLPEICKDQILEEGVKESNITLSEMCTYCNNSIFYSYRGDNRKTGSMVAIMQLMEEN